MYMNVCDSSDYAMHQELSALASTDDIVVFMKGNRKLPLCGISASVCYMLKRCNLSFSTVDLLIRPYLYLYLRTEYQPITSPYLFVEGKFVGGYDAVSSMFNSGVLGDILSIK